MCICSLGGCAAWLTSGFRCKTSFCSLGGSSIRRLAGIFPLHLASGCSASGWFFHQHLASGWVFQLTSGWFLLLASSMLHLASGWVLHLHLGGYWEAASCVWWCSFFFLLHRRLELLATSRSPRCCWSWFSGCLCFFACGPRFSIFPQMVFLSSSGSDFLVACFFFLVDHFPLFTFIYFHIPTGLLFGSPPPRHLRQPNLGGGGAGLGTRNGSCAENLPTVVRNALRPQSRRRAGKKTFKYFRAFSTSFI